MFCTCGWRDLLQIGQVALTPIFLSTRHTSFPKLEKLLLFGPSIWILLLTVVFPYISSIKITLSSRDYDSFAMAIELKSQGNWYHRFNISEHKSCNQSPVPKVFLIMTSWDSLDVDNMAINFSLKARRYKNDYFSAKGVRCPLNLI